MRAVSFMLNLWVVLRSVSFGESGTGVFCGCTYFASYAAMKEHG